MPAGTALEALQCYGLSCRFPLFEFHKIAFVRSKEFHRGFGMTDRTDAIRPVQGMAFPQEPPEI